MFGVTGLVAGPAGIGVGLEGIGVIAGGLDMGGAAGGVCGLAVGGGVGLGVIAWGEGRGVCACGAGLAAGATCFCGCACAGGGLLGFFFWSSPLAFNGLARIRSVASIRAEEPILMALE